jgi:excisionase family DNA binding protein
MARWLALPNRRAVYWLVRTKQLPASRIGRLVRFRREDVEAFIAAGGTPLSGPNPKPPEGD